MRVNRKLIMWVVVWFTVVRGMQLRVASALIGLVISNKEVVFSLALVS